MGEGKEKFVIAFSFLYILSSHCFPNEGFEMRREETVTDMMETKRTRRKRVQRNGK